MPAGDLTSLRAWAHADAVAAVLFGLALALPLFLPLPGIPAVPLAAQAVAVLGAFTLLPAEIAADAARRRQGSSLRLAVALIGLTSLAAWVAGVMTYGLSADPVLSMVNWVAVASLALAGQAFFASDRRLGWLMDVWTIGYTVISCIALAFLVERFGPTMLQARDRSEMQIAVQAIFPHWPNYFAVALAVGICILYGQILVGGPRLWTVVRFGVLLLALLATFSRTGWLACFAGVAAMTAAGGGRRRFVVLLAAGVAVVALGLQLPAARSLIIDSLRAGTRQQMGIMERVAFSVNAFRFWMEHPLFGIGFHRFDEFATAGQIVQTAGLSPEYRAYVGSVHNEYLSTLLKGGLLVASSFAVFVGMAVRVFWRAARMPGLRGLGLIGLGVTTSLLAAGLGAESFRTVSVSALFWVLAGAVQVLERRVREPTGGVVELQGARA